MAGNPINLLEISVFSYFLCLKGFQAVTSALIMIYIQTSLHLKEKIAGFA